jgi:MFS family permease
MRTDQTRRVMWASGLGWGLDAFDFYLYVYALPAILVAFGLNKSAGGLLATYTLVASAVGGITMGTLADRIGRRRALMISIACYAVFTFLCGFAQSYEQLAILRGLEGFGFGAEWAVGSVLVAEWSQAQRRGRNLGIVQGSWAIGWLGANLAFQIVFLLVPAGVAWRYLFFLGILPALALLYIRRSVDDPPRFHAQPKVTLAEIFRPALLRTTILASLLAVGAQSGYYALFTWMPTYLTTQRHLAAVTSGSYLYLVIAGAFAGYVSAGYLNDRLGRRRTFALFAICSAIMVPLYLYFVAANWQLIVAGPLLGYFASGIFSGFGPYLSELYPDTARGAGQGFCYNFGRGVAGLAPWMIGGLAGHYAIGSAMTAVAVGSYALVIVALAFLPETRGMELSQDIPRNGA